MFSYVSYIFAHDTFAATWRLILSLYKRLTFLRSFPSSLEGQRFVSVSINTCILALCKRVTMLVLVVSLSLFESESQSI